MRPGGDIACKAMQIDTKKSCFAGEIGLSQQRGQDTRQHISAASFGHAGIAGGVEVAFAAGHGDKGIVALEHDDALVFFGLLTRKVEPRKVIRGSAEKTLEFFGMWRQD